MGCWGNYSNQCDCVADMYCSIKKKYEKSDRDLTIIEFAYEYLKSELTNPEHMWMWSGIYIDILVGNGGWSGANLNNNRTYMIPKKIRIEIVKILKEYLVWYDENRPEYYHEDKIKSMNQEIKWFEGHRLDPDEYMESKMDKMRIKRKLKKKLLKSGIMVGGKKLTEEQLNKLKNKLDIIKKRHKPMSILKAVKTENGIEMVPWEDNRPVLSTNDFKNT